MIKSGVAAGDSQCAATARSQRPSSGGQRTERNGVPVRSMLLRPVEAIFLPCGTWPRRFDHVPGTPPAQPPIHQADCIVHCPTHQLHPAPLRREQRAGWLRAERVRGRKAFRIKSRADARRLLLSSSLVRGPLLPDGPPPFSLTTARGNRTKQLSPQRRRMSGLG